jgi:hypothetical protein
MSETRRPASIAVVLGVCLVAGAWTANQAQGSEPSIVGLNELVVVEPDAHERGLPAVRLEPTPAGNLRIDIPRTIHVHRYYYSGDKEFQGPILQGGPTIVVARHPLSGEQMYIDVSLPPGAPRIVHNGSSITYLYPNQRVILKFAKHHSCAVAVKYPSGRGLARRCEELHESVRDAAGNALQRSPLIQSLKQSAVEGREMIAGAADGAETAIVQLIDSARQAGGMLPGVEAVRSYGAERPVRRELESIRAAAARKARSATPYLPTNR